ncbi:MAG: ABC transporter permease subunit [Helicobacteraceae bacterium]|jgi:sulfate transport system permease protein|nr:ABC transporter permease subunit [Helicobacteraceae bacterium]
MSSTSSKPHKKTALPGFGLSLGLSMTYLSLLVLIPLGGLLLYSTKVSFERFIEIATDSRTFAAFEISFGASFLAASINAVFGLILAWVLARYNFFGKKFLDSIIDLPFAIPTAVAGISLTAIFAKNGILGQFFAPVGAKDEGAVLWLKEHIFSYVIPDGGVSISYSEIGITIALTFIGLPFIVRTVQPVIEELDKEAEEAAITLGANYWTVFRRVIFPSIYPALLTGFALAFARGLGEYGSVIFISSNKPYETEIVPLLVFMQLMEYDYEEAAAIGVLMLVCTFFLLLLINFLQTFARRRGKVKANA